MSQEGHNFTSVVFLPKMHKLSLSVRKYQTNAKERLLQSGWPIVLYKSARIMEDKEGLRNCLRLEETEI
jgi:hypothetical protein